MPLLNNSTIQNKLDLRGPLPPVFELEVLPPEEIFPQENPALELFNNAILANIEGPEGILDFSPEAAEMTEMPAPQAAETASATEQLSSLLFPTAPAFNPEEDADLLF